MPLLQSVRSYARLFISRLRVTVITGTSSTLLLFAYNPGARADHPGVAFGSEASGPINTIAATPLPRGGWAAGVRDEHIDRDAISDARLAALADAGVEDVHSVDSVNSLSLSVAHGLTDDLTISLRLPWVDRRDIRAGEHEHGEAEAHAHGSSSGLGDVVVLGSYRVFAGGGLDAALQLGFKAPSGDTTEADGDERLETEFQPGSGSWDFIVGGALSRSLGRWSLHGNVLANISTEGAQDTEIGDALFYNVAAVYRPGDSAEHVHEDGDTHHHLVFDVMLELNGETRWKNDAHGHTEPNSGGTVVYLAPGVRVSWRNVGAFLSWGFPIVDDANGIQTDVEWRLVGGLGFAF